MSPEDQGQDDRRVLILPPTRRDGEVTCAMLEKVGLSCIVCDGPLELAAEIGIAVGAVVLTDDALLDARMAEVVAVISSQPSWGDVPVILLSRAGAQSGRERGVLHSLTNVTVLDRPTSSRTLISAVQAAIRGRERQYQIRDQLESLRKAEASVREAAHRKDEFLATLAHELRNPLAPVRTGLQVLARSPSDAPTSARIREMMERQISQLVRLIDDLLDVSRISSGKVILRREHVDLRTVVEAALEASRPFVDAGRHELTVEWPDQKLWVDGDYSRLSQVVSNLVNNAAKYTPDSGRIVIQVSAEDSEAVVRVSDNGVGIPEEMLGQVFELFAQVNQTLDRAQGGLGIGLSLVRRLMELHGGTVQVESAGLGNGSTFTLRLPLLNGKPSAKPQEIAFSEHAGRRRGLRMLVIDDNQDGADTLAMLLGLEGYETRTEYNGVAAIATAREFRPHVVFCDIGLPQMDGYEFAQRLRADPIHAAVTLIALTGWGSPEDKRRSKEAGFNFHLTKPVATVAVKNLLSELAE